MAATSTLAARAGALGRPSQPLNAAVSPTAQRAMMDLDPFRGLDQLYRTLSRRHLNVHDACPATMNGQRGFLGVSRGVYYRVWFDTADDSKTLFSSMKRDRALVRYQELKRQYAT